MVIEIIPFLLQGAIAVALIYLLLKFLEEKKINLLFYLLYFFSVIALLASLYFTGKAIATAKTESLVTLTAGLAAVAIYLYIISAIILIVHEIVAIIMILSLRKLKNKTKKEEKKT